jgi:uncharacterized membrane protein YccC
LSDEGGRAVEALLDELARSDRDIALDLLHAVRTYTSAEQRLVAIDEAAGFGVSSDRAGRIDRLEQVRSTLERELRADR